MQFMEKTHSCLHFLFHTERNPLNGLWLETIMTSPKKVHINSNFSYDNLIVHYLQDCITGKKKIQQDFNEQQISFARGMKALWTSHSSRPPPLQEHSWAQGSCTSTGLLHAVFNLWIDCFWMYQWAYTVSASESNLKQHLTSKQWRKEYIWKQTSVCIFVFLTCAPKSL